MQHPVHPIHFNFNSIFLVNSQKNNYSFLIKKSHPYFLNICDFFLIRNRAEMNDPITHLVCSTKYDVYVHFNKTTKQIKLKSDKPFQLEQRANKLHLKHGNKAHRTHFVVSFHLSHISVADVGSLHLLTKGCTLPSITTSNTSFGDLYVHDGEFDTIHSIISSSGGVCFVSCHVKNFLKIQSLHTGMFRWIGSTASPVQLLQLFSKHSGMIRIDKLVPTNLQIHSHSSGNILIQIPCDHMIDSVTVLTLPESNAMITLHVTARRAWITMFCTHSTVSVDLCTQRLTTNYSTQEEYQSKGEIHCSETCERHFISPPTCAQG